MARLLMVALLALVAGSGVEARRGFGGGGGPSGLGGPSRSACSTTLAPTSTEVELVQTAFATCIAEQDGLQAIIDQLTTPAAETRHRGGGPGGCNKNKDVAALLEANNYTTEATTLRQCVARETGLLTTDNTIDMDALKATILAKVAGTSLEANTQLGLDNCPAVVDFNVPAYFGCVAAYCETGAAP